MLHPEDFGRSAGSVIKWIDRYLNHIEKYPVKSQVIPGEVFRNIPEKAPEGPEPLETILEDLDRVIMPGITHWQHPNFHAYFPANSSVESVLAESITAAIGAQCMIWDTSPAAAELEERMIGWLQAAIGFPGGFEGVIQDSASSASLVALLTAREVATGFTSNETGVPPNLRVYASRETHSSIEKAMGIAGLGRKNLVKVALDDRLRMDPEALDRAISSDLENRLHPCAVVATLGTTGTLAVDPLREIAAVCKKYGTWLHVDAAYAGNALLLPEYREMARGVEGADSFVFNPHKWMFTNFDCSIYLVKNASLLIRTLEVLPEYLKTGTRGSVNDYRDWGVPLGRRFRALKLWFVIRSYGLEGIKGRLRSQISLNSFFHNELVKIEGMELAAEPFLNFTAFRWNPGGTRADRLNELNREILERINRNGKIFLTHTKVGERMTLRVVFGQTYLERRHVEVALEEIHAAVNSVRKQNDPE